MADDEIKTGDVVVYENNMLDILKLAVDKLGGEGAESTVAAIERLADLKIKMDKVDAEKEFNKALAEFQAECPPIKKASTAKIASRGGASFSYKYAELDEIARTVKPYLFHRGLSYNWDSGTTNGVVKTICCLRHKNGHSIQASFQAPIPNELGSMNEIQRHAAVLTYVKRQALVEVLGLTTTENDTDGVDPSTIDEKQLKILKFKVKQSGANIDKLLKFLDVDKLESVRNVQFATAVAALDALDQKKKQAPKKESEQESEPTQTEEGNATTDQIEKL